MEWSSPDFPFMYVYVLTVTHLNTLHVQSLSPREGLTCSKGTLHRCQLKHVSMLTPCTGRVSFIFECRLLIPGIVLLSVYITQLGLEYWSDD